MIRQFLASVSALALLAGFVAAPYTHLHPSEQGAANHSSHAHGHAVLHSHMTSHEGGHDSDTPADTDPHDGDDYSVDAFVFAPVKIHALTDAVVVIPQGIAPPGIASVWTSISPQTPPDYGSPPILPSSPRAPPIFAI